MMAQIPPMPSDHAVFDHILADAMLSILELDRHLTLCTFTPGASVLIGESALRVGMPIEDIAARFFPDDLAGTARTVMQSLRPVRRELTCTDKTIFCQVTPRCTDDNQSNGVLLTLIDITQWQQRDDRQKKTRATLAHHIDRERVRVCQQQAQLRSLAWQLSQSEHRERQRIARILHDRLQQQLVGAKFNLGMVRRRLGSSEHAQALEQIEKLLEETLRSSRDLTVELDPPMLQDAGLCSALGWLVERMEEDNGLNVHFQCDLQDGAIHESVRPVIFDAVRELLLNVAKHASVNSADLILRRTDQHLMIVVRDEGTGFDVESLRQGRGMHYGLYNLQRRLNSFGGTMDIQSHPGNGTHVTLMIEARMAMANGSGASDE